MDYRVVRVVTVTCPRCCGEGKRDSWHPNQGICYRCKGAGTVTICLNRYEAALGYLRTQYCSLRIVGRASSDPVERRFIALTMEGIKAKGLALRAFLDKAKQEAKQP